MSELMQDLSATMNHPRSWSDETLDESVRGILEKRGYADARTASRQEINSIVKQEILNEDEKL